MSLTQLWETAMRRTVALAVVFLGTFTLSAPAQAVEEEAPSGCAAFGANVAGLATDLGPVFGETASGVASSAPQAFPTLVVRPEQERFCAG